MTPAAPSCGDGGGAMIGWQTLLADLSLILFMVTAAAMAKSPDARRPARPIAAPAQLPAAEPPCAQPLAVWRGGGSQTLHRWLAGQQTDPRQQLTIAAYYAGGGAARALASAQALVGEAGTMGRAARVIVAPAGDPRDTRTIVSLAYDRPVQAPDR